MVSYDFASAFGLSVTRQDIVESIHWKSTFWISGHFEHVPPSWFPNTMGGRNRAGGMGMALMKKVESEIQRHWHIKWDASPKSLGLVPVLRGNACIDPYVFSSCSSSSLSTTAAVDQVVVIVAHRP